MKPVDSGEVAFFYQSGLSLQPVLHIVPWQGSLVHVSEIGPSGHFVG